MRRCIVSALAAVLLLGCGGPNPSPVSAGEPPAARRCRDAWADVPAPQRTYDFTNDTRRTSRGNEGYAAFAERLPRRSCSKAWTVLIYIAADNDDMPPYAYWHLNEMEAAFEDAGLSAASTLDADVVVQLDLKDPPGIRRLHLFRSPAVYSQEQAFGDRAPTDIHSPIVTYLEEETIPPGESLARFLTWGAEAYPSDHYLVVVWGHGLGFRPAGLAGNTFMPGSLKGGIAFDHSQRSVIDTPGLGSALGSAARASLGGRPFDIYASDACLMQSLEVTSELTSAARYLVGSEQIEDYLGFPYRRLLPQLNGTGAEPPAAQACVGRDVACRVAHLLPALQREAFLPGGLYAHATPQAAETFTLSALDAGALVGALYPSMGQLSAALTEYVREDPLRGADLEVLLGVDRGGSAPGHGMPGFLGGSRDVGVFLSGLRGLVQREFVRGPRGMTPAAARLSAAIEAASASLRRTVIARSFGARYDGARHAGMAGVSVWLPHDADEFERRIDFFASSRFYAATGNGANSWRGWLDEVFAPPDPAPEAGAR